MRYEICVIGSEALLFPFLQFGFTTYTPPSEDALRDYLKDIITKNYGIIYIEEGESYFQKTVKEMTENAIGTNII